MESTNNVNIIQLIFTTWNAQLYGDSLLKEEVSEAPTWCWNIRRAMLFYAFLCTLKQVLDKLLASLQVSCVLENCAHRQEALSVLFATSPSNLAVCVGVGKQANFRERINARNNCTRWPKLEIRTTHGKPSWSCLVCFARGVSQVPACFIAHSSLECNTENLVSKERCACVSGLIYVGGMSTPPRGPHLLGMEHQPLRLHNWCQSAFATKLPVMIS